MMRVLYLRSHEIILIRTSRIWSGRLWEIDTIGFRTFRYYWSHLFPSATNRGKWATSNDVRRINCANVHFSRILLLMFDRQVRICTKSSLSNFISNCIWIVISLNSDYLEGQSVKGEWHYLWDPAAQECPSLTASAVIFLLRRRYDSWCFTDFWSCSPRYISKAFEFFKTCHDFYNGKHKLQSKLTQLFQLLIMKCDQSKLCLMFVWEDNPEKRIRFVSVFLCFSIDLHRAVKIYYHKQKITFNKPPSPACSLREFPRNPVSASLLIDEDFN
jgi:hypothetical protein